MSTTNKVTVKVKTPKISGREAISSMLGNMEDWINHKITEIRPFRAVVTAINSGLIAIQTDDEDDSTGDEEYTRCVGLPVSVGDEVMCLRLKHSLFIIGKIHTAAVPAYSYTKYFAQSTATNATNASTVNYVDAASYTVTLTKGTWIVSALGGLALINSASDDCDMRVTIDGTAGASRNTPNLSSTVYSQWVDNASETTIAVATATQDVTIAVQYKPTNAGTATAANPWVSVAVRMIDG